MQDSDRHDSELSAESLESETAVLFKKGLMKNCMNTDWISSGVASSFSSEMMKRLGLKSEYR